MTKFSVKKNWVAGLDDATKCPCIGSIMLAGVFATNQTVAKWTKLGVTDSKKLSRKRRDELAQIIKQTAIAYSIKEMTPAMIDDKSYNLNEWEMLTALNIADDLTMQSGFLPRLFHIDNWEVNGGLFTRRLQHIYSNFKKDFKYQNVDKINFRAGHRADERFTVVGAASILAKSASDAQFDEYRKLWPIGSGSPGDPTTRTFVFNHRKKPLPIIRQSWETFKVLSKLSTIEDDYWYARKKIKMSAKK